MAKKILLFIDDDSIFAHVAHAFLRKQLLLSWDIELITEPLVGLARLAFDKSVQACIVDILMPDLCGDELVEQAIANRPELRGRIIVCSGFMNLDDDERFSRLFTEFGCLRIDKPFDPEKFIELVWSVIGPIEYPEG